MAHGRGVLPRTPLPHPQLGPDGAMGAAPALPDANGSKRQRPECGCGSLPACSAPRPSSLTRALMSSPHQCSQLPGLLPPHAVLCPRGFSHARSPGLPPDLPQGCRFSRIPMPAAQDASPKPRAAQHPAWPGCLCPSPKVAGHRPPPGAPWQPLLLQLAWEPRPLLPLQPAGLQPRLGKPRAPNAVPLALTVATAPWAHCPSQLPPSPFPAPQPGAKFSPGT